MARSKKKTNEHEVVGDVAKWHKEEDIALSEKLEEAKIRLESMEEKLDQWRSLTDAQKKKKCIGKLRSVFNKPFKMLLKLKLLGDDIIAAAEENLKPYRIERIIQVYEKHREKLLEAVDVARKFSDDYPEPADLLDGFSWSDDEIPETFDSEGNLVILTSDGVQKAKLK